jgi:CO/xanthine dehydrogenase Mo-binding subunit
VEGPDKVSGRARYAADQLPPGVIWGKAHRSALPHARIVRVDTSRARAVPGVLAVLTAADLPDVLVGRVMFDMPVLARDRVRFIGEKVAVAAAEDPDVAEEAAALIEVEYEDLPAIFDPLEAIHEGAFRIHEDPASYANAPKEHRPYPNLQSVLRHKMGDPAKGFAEAAHVFEHTFRTPRVHQGYLEPTASTVALDGDGRVHVWASNKMPFRLRDLLAHTLQVPADRIQVHLCPIGGDFGGKGSVMDTPLCYHLARVTGRPVKMVMSYTEELMAGNPRHASVITLRSGVTRDGRLVARTARAVFDGGAYAAFKPVPHVNLIGAALAQGPYRIPHIEVESFCAYTNQVPCGHMRSPGDPQMIFAEESHMDMMAAALRLDPAAFRRRNLIQEGDHLVDGHHMEKVRARETLDAALKAGHWGKPKPRPNVGRGVAMSYRHDGMGMCNARVTLEADGNVTLLTVTPDTGTGSHTILQQIVAEVLGITPAAVCVRVGDTRSFAMDSGTGGSRVTHVAGHAAREAAEQVRARILAEAAALLKAAPETLELGGGHVAPRRAGGRRATLAEVAAAARRRGHPIDAAVRKEIGSYPPLFSFCAQVAEVEVDRETGQGKMLRVTSAHDTGTVLNPLGFHGQINGGLIQALGFATMEELHLEEGRVTTLSLGDFKVPTIRDIPPLTTVLVEKPVGPGPFNAKSIGESSNVPLAAAIANAVADACGVRITDAPVTAEKVYRGLRQRAAAAPGRGKRSP